MQVSGQEDACTDSVSKVRMPAVCGMVGQYILNPQVRGGYLSSNLSLREN